MSKKRGIKIAGILVILFVIVGVSKDLILKSVVSTAASKITGAKVTMSGFSLGLITQSVAITDFKMYNPAGFPEGVMIDIPKVRVSLNVGALLEKKLHIRLAEFTLKEVVLTKNKEGQLNIQSLAMMKQGKVEPKKKEEPAEKKESKMMPFLIDELSLDIGRVVEEDYAIGEQPTVKVHEVNLKKTFRDITSVQQLALLIVSQSLQQSAFKGAVAYGAATLAGAAVLPVGVAAVLVGQDSAVAEFALPVEQVLNASRGVLAQMGTITSENTSSGVLKAKVQGCDVALQVLKNDSGSTKVTVSARKLFIPKPQIAGGVLHEIAKQLQAP